jgi:glycosyltransferase involved in cell wall biosynthesis
MSNIFLTIAIPTYNRSTFLNNQIKNLIYIIEDNFFELQIELLILNNNSEDETDQIVIEYIKQYSFIKYIKNEFNIGLIVFIALLILGVFAILYAYKKLQTKNKKIALQSLRREMNPHFIFNSG